MIKFIPAKELKAIYNVFGHFYSVEFSKRKRVPCRSVLELVSKVHTPSNIDAVSEKEPDAVFVMMNPGSSKPLTDVSNRISAKTIHKLPVSLVPTKPDTTQYQVMRIMRYCNWQHVRVLNLSDLRCAQSGEFVKQYQRLEEVGNFESHSIFSEARKNELSSKLPRSRKLPIVFAWGVSDKLDPLIERCTSRISGKRNILGLLKEGTTNKYFHPLPSLQKQKLLWVDEMVGRCKQ